MEKIIEKLNVHYRKNWEIEKYNKNIIQLNFKEDEEVSIILAPSVKIVQYRFDEDTKHSYEYTSKNKEAQEIFDGIRCFYPKPIKGNSNEFDTWVDDWMHDYSKRNKRARELYGFEKR